MDGVLGGIFGGSKPSASSETAGDAGKEPNVLVLTRTLIVADFADFAEAPEPSPALSATSATLDKQFASPTGSTLPYSKWYNVHERHSLSEFKQEGIILSLMLVVIFIHRLGTRTNRKKAQTWIKSLAPTLNREFALVGFHDAPNPTADGTDREQSANVKVDALLKETSLHTFITYATGRNNVASLDVGLTLFKRYNPILLFIEHALGLFFESFEVPVERMEAILSPFDGKESQMVPEVVPGATELRKDNKSSYDGFVWAVVNKDCMKQLRNDRYDVSITSTKDHAKLPVWATVMSESSEVTDLLLTPEFLQAVEKAGDLLQYVIVSDQPIDRPNRYVSAGS